MSQFPPNAMLYTQGFGSASNNLSIPHYDTRAPATTDIAYPLGKFWVDTLGENSYQLVSLSSFNGTTTATWNALGAVSGNINVPGNITAGGTITAGTGITSTTGNITATAGSVNAGTSMTASLGNITATNGNLVLGTVGNLVEIKGGSALAMIGTATLASGTVTISNTNIATGDIILLSRVSVNGSTTLGVLTYTISNGASFTITSVILGTPASTQTADTSVVGYVIFRPI